MSWSSRTNSFDFAPTGEARDAAEMRDTKRQSRNGRDDDNIFTASANITTTTTNREKERTTLYYILSLLYISIYLDASPSSCTIINEHP